MNTQTQIRAALENVIGKVSEDARPFAEQMQSWHAEQIARQAKDLTPEDALLIALAIDTLTK